MVVGMGGRWGAAWAQGFLLAYNSSYVLLHLVSEESLRAVV